MWLITNDYINKESDGTNRTGKKSYNFNKNKWAKTNHIPFRLYDDDKIHYYSGLIDEESLYGNDETLMDAPLRWAMADAGCTSMLYLEKGQWIELTLE